MSKETAQHPVQELVSGPMVEYQQRERERAKTLHQWWIEKPTDEGAHATKQTTVNEAIPTLS